MVSPVWIDGFFLCVRATQLLRLARHKLPCINYEYPHKSLGGPNILRASDKPDEEDFAWQKRYFLSQCSSLKGPLLVYRVLMDWSAYRKVKFMDPNFVWFRR